MYGLRPSSSGVYGNGPFPWKVAHMQDYVTLPRWFARNGYVTATTGKIYHSSGLPDGDFDIVGPRPGQRMNDLDERLRKELSGLWDFGPQRYDETLFQDHVDATWAIQQLQELGDKPFFLAVGFYRPHVPFYAPTRVFEQVPRDSVTLPPVKDDDWNDIPPIAHEVTFNEAPPPHSWFVENDTWKDAVQAYLACIRWTDEQVGRVLDALAASQHADDTVVILYSDHGFHLGEKQHWTKFTLWERSAHVPFVIMVPELPGDQRIDRPVELLSIYPTLTELCGLPANPEVEGRSLVALMKDPEMQWPYHALTTHGKDNHSVRSDRYRYIRYKDGSEELYDMIDDPNEWTNLLADGISESERKLVADLGKSLPVFNHQPARASRN